MKVNKEILTKFSIPNILLDRMNSTENAPTDSKNSSNTELSAIAGKVKVTAKLATTQD